MRKGCLIGFVSEMEVSGGGFLGCYTVTVCQYVNIASSMFDHVLFLLVF